MKLESKVLNLFSQVVISLHICTTIKSKAFTDTFSASEITLAGLKQPVSYFHTGPCREGHEATELAMHGVVGLKMLCVYMLSCFSHVPEGKKSKIQDALGEHDRGKMRKWSHLFTIINLKRRASYPSR